MESSMNRGNLNVADTIEIDAKVFRDGMSKVMAAVHIITIKGTETNSAMGTTATAVCSVSDAPPTLLVCLHRQGRVCNAVSPGIELTVNTLADGHMALADIFAGRDALTMEERFSHGNWEFPPDSAPMLKDSVVSFQTKVVQVIDASSHSIVVCRVKDINSAEVSTALLYGTRSYRSLPLVENRVSAR